MKSYVPNTAAQRAEMLRAIGMSSMEDLFRDIPEDVRLKAPLKLDRGMSEEEVRRVFRAYAKNTNAAMPIFRGAGAYRQLYTVHRSPACRALGALYRIHPLPGRNEPGHAAGTV